MLSDGIIGHDAVLLLAAGMMIAAAFMDARSYRIPNVLSLALFALFPVHVLTALQPVAWDQHLFIFGLVLAAGFFLYAKKYIGAGDIKLLAVVSLWAGPSLVGLLLFITTVAGGLLAIMTAGVMYYRQRKNSAAAKVSVGKTPIPYGVAIAMGGLCTLMVLFHPALLP